VIRCSTGTDDQLDRLLSCMGYRLDVTRRPVLSTFREDPLPADATMSVEIDILPIAGDIGTG
jgi:hypothetical protein